MQPLELDKQTNKQSPVCIHKASSIIIIMMGLNIVSNIHATDLRTSQNC